MLARARRMGTDVLVIDSICATFTWPWFVAGPPPMPTVAMLHQPPGGVDHGRTRRALQVRLDRFVYGRVDRLLLASDSLAHALAREGVQRERMAVVPPGRDAAGPESAAEGGEGASPMDLRRGRRAAFLCVANWLPPKGIDSLLEAFSRLPPDAGTLHLVGDDRASPAHGEQLWERLRRPDLRDRVVVHGPVSRRQVAALYRSADVFALPSLREAYGTVYGEAMAEGLPVVGLRIGNLPYLADDDREGLLVEPGDLDGLATALAQLADDEDLRTRLGTAARARAQARPTWDETARMFFGELRRVVRDRRDQPGDAV